MSDQRVADLVAYGVPRETAEAAYGRKTPGTLGVFPDLLPAVLFFCRLRYCWRISETGTYCGLDWGQTAAKIGLLVPRRDRAQLTERLETMEEAALEVLNGK